eukprot:sb/3463211/
MEGLDKEKVNEIIRAASKGSKFSLHVEKKEKELQDKVNRMLEERAALTSAQTTAGQAAMDIIIAQLESTRDMSRDIVHVDMDAFYAAVEMRDNPGLREVPMAVGGNSMLSTSNYLARKHGVRSAMPGFIARKLCPNLVIVPCNFEKYRAASQLVMGVVGEYTDLSSAASLDEVYLDITAEVRKRMEEGGGERADVAWTIVKEMREKIREKTELTASAGIACNTFIAKVCSDLNKPNGQYQVRPDRETIIEFVSGLEIRKVPGIGRVQQAMLAGLGVKVVSDIITERGTIGNMFSPLSAEFYMSRALGLGSTDLSGASQEVRSSMSTESTFSSTELSNKSSPTTLTKAALTILSELSETLAERLAAEKLAGVTLSVKVKLSTFEIIQRSKTVSYAVSKRDEIERLGRGLLEVLAQERRGEMEARLMGVRVHNFISSGTPQQHTLHSYTASQEEEGEEREQWECPVCFVSLPPQLSSFNRHVDKCISGEEMKKGEQINREEVKKVGETNREQVKKRVQTNKEQRKGKKRKSDEYHECPVCGKSVTSDLTLLNIHIDRCLGASNGSLGITNGGNSGGQPSAKVQKLSSKKQPSSLMSYFKKQ